MKLPLWRIAEFTAAKGDFDQELVATGYSINSRTGGNGANYPIAVSEFNVFTSGGWPAGTTPDSNQIYPKMAAMLVSAANASTNGAPKELYMFKFGLNTVKDATHYMDHAHSPYNVGGVTKEGQVYHLFAKGFIDRELTVAMTRHLGEHRFHRVRHTHHCPYLMIGPVTALALFLVADRREQREKARTVA